MENNKNNVNEFQQLIDEQKPKVERIIKSNLRELVLTTNGANITVVKNEWTTLEMIAGLEMLLKKLKPNN